MGVDIRKLEEGIHFFLQILGREGSPVFLEIELRGVDHVGADPSEGRIPALPSDVGSYCVVVLVPKVFIEILVVLVCKLWIGSDADTKGAWVGHQRDALAEMGRLGLLVLLHGLDDGACSLRAIGVGDDAVVALGDGTRPPDLG